VLEDAPGSYVKLRLDAAGSGPEASTAADAEQTPRTDNAKQHEEAGSSPKPRARRMVKRKPKKSV
jgi:hypothetical protein